MDEDEIRRRLAEHGQARTDARAAVERESAAIRELAPQAVAAGIPKIEVCKLAQISRPALDAML